MRSAKDTESSLWPTRDRWNDGERADEVAAGPTRPSEHRTTWRCGSDMLRRQVHSRRTRLMNCLRIFCAAGAALVASCGSSSTYFEDLKTPVVAWVRSRGNCGSGLALDADGGVWSDRGGCEDGRPTYAFLGTATADGAAEVRQAVEALPRDGGPDRATCGGNLDTFSEWNSSVSSESRACSTGIGSATDGLAEPYLSVARLFLALP